jgi:chorismate dehydratase
MSDAHAKPRADATIRVGCVAYLNAKPLIHGVERRGLRVSLDVPARLIDGLLGDAADLSLCPVIDYFRSPERLAIVPAGCIACHGPTLTVRLFSRVPIERVRVVHGDVESHTSVTLLRILCRELYERSVELLPWVSPGREGYERSEVEAVLLIGDKVITAAPPRSLYPFDLDLGEAWARLTGLPFVFACWMCREDQPLGEVASALSEQLERNLQDIDTLAETYSGGHGWPTGLARRYLGEILRYRLGDAERRGLLRFRELAAKHGLIDDCREPTYRTR